MGGINNLGVLSFINRVGGISITMDKIMKKKTIKIVENKFVLGMGYVRQEPKELPEKEALKALQYQNVFRVNEE